MLVPKKLATLSSQVPIITKGLGKSEKNSIGNWCFVTLLLFWYIGEALAL